MVAVSKQFLAAPFAGEVTSTGEGLLTGEAARRLGISTYKFDRERKAGRIPECVMVGRYFIVPADKIESIRARLVAAGRIDPARDLPFVRVPALAGATS